MRAPTPVARPLMIGAPRPAPGRRRVPEALGPRSETRSGEAPSAADVPRLSRAGDSRYGPSR